VKVTASERVGGSVEEPKEYIKEFDYKDVDSTHLYIAQLFSTYPEISLDNGLDYQTVFKSGSPRSAPTGIYIGENYYRTDSSNRIIMEDVDSSPERSYLPESTFQWGIWVPSQVGYGGLFENQSLALEDARERLEDRMGRFVDATGIDTGTLSTGNQPYLWGPASVRLVIWRE
jgi:hypothetical protein